MILFIYKAEDKLRAENGKKDNDNYKYNILIMDLQGRVETVPYSCEPRWKNTLVCSRFLPDTFAIFHQNWSSFIEGVTKVFWLFFMAHSIDLWLLYKYYFNIYSVYFARFYSIFHTVGVLWTFLFSSCFFCIQHQRDK